jgi:formate hydrogenlyase subunit 6/NADH:ubiquinone oxidoreductase subunit I
MDSSPVVLGPDGLEDLVTELRRRRYRVIGPTVRDGAVVADEIDSAAELPAGYGDDQAPGHYRLRQNGDGAVFGFGTTAISWKPFLLPPDDLLWRATRDDGGFRILPEPAARRPLALLGLRPCDLAAIRILDGVFLSGPHPDRSYASRRDRALFIAVNCATPAATCFCTSMGGGPRAESGFDLALTELPGSPSGRFVVETGSEAGGSVVAALPSRAANIAELLESQRVTDEARRRIADRPGLDAVRTRLAAGTDDPHWAEVAQRCLACGNCTAVCPTCFCTSVADTTDLTGSEASRRRRWDSCFSVEFSYLHSGPVRTSLASRYRQWLTHKLSWWSDQFDTSGCVGCGRCITWCPAAIDLVAEADAIGRAPEHRGAA